MIPTDEEMLVARAIRQGLETEQNPGNAVSGTPNPFQVYVNGSYILTNAARVVLTQLEAHRAAKAAQKAADEAKTAKMDPTVGDQGADPA